MKFVDVEAKEIVRFEFGTKYFNPYDPHNICKDHEILLSWISGAFHWLEEDPWRYCHNASRLN